MTITDAIARAREQDAKRALEIAVKAMQAECAKFNFPDEDRPLLHDALAAIESKLRGEG